MTTEGSDERDAAGAAVETWLGDATRPVDEVLAALGDEWSPSLLRGVTSAPAFVIEAGTVRRRGEDEPFEPPTDVSTTRGVLCGRSWPALVMAIPASEATGSVTVNARVGAALGVLPGDERHFDAGDGELRLRWHSPHHRQPELSGLAAASPEAVTDDLLIVRLDRRAPMAAVEVLGAEASPDVIELAGLLGLDVATMAVDLAEALDVHGDQAAAALRRRGDRRLAEVVAGATWR